MYSVLSAFPRKNEACVQRRSSLPLLTDRMVPSVPPLQPPPNLQDPNLDTLFARYLAVTCQAGFKIKKGHRGSGQRRNTYWLCQFGPTTRNTKSKGHSKLSCPFSLRIQQSSDGDFRGSVLRSIHNHGPVVMEGMIYDPNQESVYQVPSNQTHQYYREREQRIRMLSAQGPPTGLGVWELNVLPDKSLCDSSSDNSPAPVLYIPPPFDADNQDGQQSEAENRILHEETALYAEQKELDEPCRQQHLIFLEQCRQNICPRCGYEMDAEMGGRWRKKANGDDFSKISVGQLISLCEEHELSAGIREWMKCQLPLDNRGLPCLNPRAVDICSRSLRRLVRGICSRRYERYLWLREFVDLLQTKHSTTESWSRKVFEDLAGGSMVSMDAIPNLGYYGQTLNHELRRLTDGLRLDFSSIPALAAIGPEAPNVFCQGEMKVLIREFVLYPELVTELVMEDMGYTDRGAAVSMMKSTSHVSHVIELQTGKMY